MKSKTKLPGINILRWRPSKGIASTKVQAPWKSPVEFVIRRLHFSSMFASGVCCGPD